MSPLTLLALLAFAAPPPLLEAPLRPPVAIAAPVLEAAVLEAAGAELELRIQDTAAAPADSTAIAGPAPAAPDRLIPIAVLLLASLIMAGARWASPRFKQLPGWAHTSLLGIGTVLLNTLATAVAYQAPSSLDQWTDTTVEGLLAAVAAHLIYQRGKRSGG